MKFHFLILLFLALASLPTKSQTPALPLPTGDQIAWHETNFYLFLHFGPNTFTNLEWGHGTETEDLFNPTALDCEQWCQVAKAAGAKGLIITAKHHDGFCLWPSAYSTHTVRESPWRNGKGDVLRELSDACRRNGLLFGVYLSPWDRNHPKYGTSEYNDVYANTLTELLTGYGPLFEVWWDGANGEGPNGKRQTYDFHRFEKLVAKHQPQAIIFSDIGPGCRWAGNEQGTVNETNWAGLDTAGFGRGATGPPADRLQTGQPYGAVWIPAECDVSIRPGWFYHPEEDDKVKTADQLWEIYLQSVGRGANLILNVPPNRQGRIAPQDSAALVAFGQKKDAAFARKLPLKARLCGSKCGFGPMKVETALTDGDWRTAEPLIVVDSSACLWFDLGRSRTFNAVELQEWLGEGQRIQSFRVEVEQKGVWKEVARSTTVGHKKILTFPAVKARRVRISVTAALAPPLLSEVKVFRF